MTTTFQMDGKEITVEDGKLKFTDEEVFPVEKLMFKSKPQSAAKVKSSPTE